VIKLVTNAFVPELQEYCEQQKYRVLVGIRMGLRDWLIALTRAVILAAMRHEGGFDPAHHRGADDLVSILQRGIKLSETDYAIYALYHPKNLGLQPHYWLEFGARRKAVVHKLLAIDMGGAVGDELYRFGRRESVQPATPFIYPTFEQYKTEVVAMIQARIQEAMSA
jgi:hypothetical protein